MAKLPEVDIDFLPASGEQSGEGVSEVIASYLRMIEDIRDQTLRSLEEQARRRLMEVDRHFRDLRNMPSQPTESRLIGVPADLHLLDIGRDFWRDTQIVLPSLGTLLGVWLQARFGRRVRIKVGDIEAEARTAEEVDKLLKRAQEIKEANERKRILEP